MSPRLLILGPANYQDTGDDMTRDCASRKALCQPVPPIGAEVQFRFVPGAEQPEVVSAELPDDCVSCLTAHVRPCTAVERPCELKVLAFPGDERFGELDPPSGDSWTISARTESASAPLTSAMVYAIFNHYQALLQGCLPTAPAALAQEPLSFTLAYDIRFGREGQIMSVESLAGREYYTGGSRITREDPHPEHPSASLSACLSRRLYDMWIYQPWFTGPGYTGMVVVLFFSQPQNGD